uniref:Uncharacterized protein n=1 Tax=Nicotiana tabacum TaxID=4097 RepID=A0A1S4CKR4_TOBAC|nr:PREDICTED: uncharacterized protein LOC107820128 [Nicotiana tabacum]
MKDGESVEEIFSRFSKILGDLKSFGRPIKSGDLERSSEAYLQFGSQRSLRWNVKIWRKFLMMSSEVDRQIQEKKKTVAFKATVAEPENEEEEEGGEQDENIAMLSQIVTSMIRRNRNNRRGKSNFRKGRMSNEADKNDGRCYECGKFGHIQADCPELKKKLSRSMQKKKAFGAWSDEEESDHEKIANICFMVLSDKEDSRELGLMAYINDEEDNSREPRSLSDEGTSEVCTPLCPICYELQEFVDISLADIERVVNALRRTKREKEREKKDWALKLEVCEIERDMLQDEVNELKLQLNGLQKTTSLSPVKTIRMLITRRKSLVPFVVKMAIVLTIAGTELELKVVLVTLTTHPAPIVVKEATPQIIAVTKLDGGTVTFGDKYKGNVIGVGKVPLSSTCDVDEVYLVDELGYNLLSISQLCGNDYEVHFKKHGWFIEDESGNIILSDDFSRFTWVMFLSHKDDALKNFEVFCKKVQREKRYNISTIRSDHGGEFESRAFEN